MGEEETSHLLGGSIPNSPASGAAPAYVTSYQSVPDLVPSAERVPSSEGPPMATRRHSLAGSTCSGISTGSGLIGDVSDHERTGVGKSYFVSLKGFVGVGVLTLPYAMTHTGLIVGIFGLCVVGFMTWWSMSALVCTRDGIKDPTVHTIGDVAYDVFGPPGKNVVETALIVTQFGFCCGYLVFASNTMNTLVAALPPYAWTLLIVPVVIMLTWLPSLGKLSWASFGGVMMIFFGVGVVVIYSSIEIATSDSTYHSTFKLAKLKTLPIFLAISVAVWEGVALVLPTRAQMSEPKEYPRVLNFTIATVGTLYLLTSILGYIAYGDNLLSIVTLNLPQKGHIVPLTEISFVVMVIFTYPVQFYPVIETVERSATFGRFAEKCVGEHGNRDLVSKLTRAGLVLCTGGVAMLIPNYGLVVSLVGSLGGATLSLVLPNLLYLARHHRDISYMSIAVCWIIVGIGIIVAVIGTTESVYLFIAEFDGRKH